MTSGAWLAGVGLHTGERVRARFVPLSAGAGLWVRRLDADLELPVRPEHVVPRDRCTCLGAGGATLETVEHALAALTGLGVADARLEVDGPEAPLADGSALPWVLLARETGLRAAGARRRIERPFRFARAESELRCERAEGVEIVSTVDFAPPIGVATARWRGDPAAFERDVAPARTFAFLHEVEALRRDGRIRGGTLDGAVVLGPDGVLNAEGLRFPDEPARHKLLDLLGDLALVGGAPLGRVSARRYGHAFGAEALRAWSESGRGGANDGPVAIAAG